MRKSTLFILSFLFLIIPYTFAQVSVIPKPNDSKWKEGKFSFAKGVDVKIIRGDDPTKLIQKQLAEFLRKKNISVVPFSGTAISIHLVAAKDGDLPSEAYTLIVSTGSVSITSTSNAGLFYGMQTLFQLINTDTSRSLSCVEINDQPAFSYRGMHLDVSRHFFGTDVIKQYLDMMAKLKMNRFHWHLTDDQGWRIEIKKYPKLTQVGACRTEKDASQYCGFYTQEEIKQIVQYAKERYIEIIPEIDVPGHASAIIAAYPELGCYNQNISVPNTFGIKEDVLCPSDSTFRFLKDVLDEVCGLFPSPYIHMGGDEIPNKHWTGSEKGKAFSSEKNIASKDIASYFLKQIETHLTAKGKKCIGWGEIMDGSISKDMTVMSWRGINAGVKAAQQGNDVVMAPRQFCYFDYPQDWDDSKQAIYMTYLPLEKVYGFNPLSKVKGDAAQKHILGGQACVWTEFIEQPEQLQYQVYPRILAMSECLWTSKSGKKFSDFQKRLKAQKNYFVTEKEFPKIDMVRIKPKEEKK